MFVIPDNISPKQSLVEMKAGTIKNERKNLEYSVNKYIHESLSIHDSCFFDITIRSSNQIRDRYEILITIFNRASTLQPKYDKIREELKVDSVIDFIDRFWKEKLMFSWNITFIYSMRYFTKNYGSPLIVLSEKKIDR